MSLLPEDFGNSQHEFAEVIDEDTTSGGLDTFEISSSNSLPTCSSNAGVVAVDDSSSTDTIKIVDIDSGSGATSRSNGFFNSNEVYVINDDDDEDVDDDIDVDDNIVDEDDDDDDDDDVDEEIAANPQTSTNFVNVTQRAVDVASHLESQTNGVIMTSAGTAIYLETPVIEDHHHHHPQLLELVEANDITAGIDNAANNSNNNNNSSSSSSNSNNNIAQPKRLSDEFLLAENAELVELDDADDDVDEVVNANANVNVNAIHEHGPAAAGLRFNYNATDVKTDDCCAETSTTDSAACCSKDRVASTLNRNNLQLSSMAEIESMDLIERRDFESEQRLTNGMLMKSSAFMNKNFLNLNLVKSYMPQTQMPVPSMCDALDEFPSSSNYGNKRAVSSDSKCAYKDASTTPTSSRNHNSRLTKSTAKINLCSSLYPTQNDIALNQPTREQCGQSSDLSFSNANDALSSSSVCNSSSSSVIVDGKSVFTNASNTGPVITEVFSNCSINDVFIADNSSAAQAQVFPQPKRWHSVQHLQGAEAAENENGCSRTHSFIFPEKRLLTNEDMRASTSAARCQFGSGGSGASGGVGDTKPQRQVNASAQTNEQFLRLGVSSTASSSNSSSSGSGSGSSSSSNSSNANSAASATIVAADIAANVAGNSAGIAGSLRNRRRRHVYDAIRELSEVATSDVSVDEFSKVWGECEEISSDVEELCTCQQSGTDSSHGGSNMSLNDAEELDNSVAHAHASNKDGDLSNYIQMVSISEDNNGNAFAAAVAAATAAMPSVSGVQQQRKRKYNDGRLLDGYSNYNADVNACGSGSGVGGGGGNNNSSSSSGSCYMQCGSINGRSKRIAYDTASSTSFSGMLAMPPLTPTNTQLSFTIIGGVAVGGGGSGGSPMGRRTPRPLIPNRDNPPPELQSWLVQFQRWSHAERLLAVDCLIEHCDPTQVRHMMKVIEPQFQRDFISLLPRELALQVLSFLEPKDLLRAAQTCRSWRFLCDDNLLWKEKCRKAQIITESRNDRPKRGRTGSMPPIASVWKAAYMRQHIIESNWRSRPIREPKVLKGHDDHVITCLQFSGNRIVSGSDDNTLKVWSAVTGKCLKTLIGHTGGVWSSQMSGKIIISGSTDRTLKVWDMETGICVHTLLGHTSTVRCMHLHGNKVVSGSRDATLRVWDIKQGTCLHVLVGHLAAVRCVQYDGKLIVSGAYDYMVKIWHPERQECLHTLQGHTNRVYSLQFDGIHVVSGSLDTSIRVWDVETGNCKHTLMGHQSLTSGMELRQNILVSGNADSTVKVWDITSGQCLQTLSGPNKHQSAVTCLQFNSRFVVTSSDDGTVKLWDVKTGEFIRNLVALESGGSGGVVWRIRASDTKLICAVGSRNGTEETKLMVLDFDVEGACVKCS